jgi:hypothetical protein
LPPVEREEAPPAEYLKTMGSKPRFPVATGTPSDKLQKLRELRMASKEFVNGMWLLWQLVT